MSRIIAVTESAKTRSRKTVRGRHKVDAHSPMMRLCRKLSAEIH